jgi:hypothetical protein
VAAQQSLQQMLIDPAQSTDADPLPKFVQHPHPRPVAAQPAEPTPRRLFGQLGHDQIERMRRSQQRQQMRAPQLRRAQRTPPPTGEQARTQIVNEVVGHIRRDQVEQAVGASRWK